MSKVELPELPYAYGALWPHIPEEIMTLHHKRHHQTYVNGYNAAQESLSKLVGDSASTREQIALQAAIKFNGGGHINHSLFWKNLAPENSEETKLTKNGPLEMLINDTWGEMGAFQNEFNTASLEIEGAGWCWLAYHPSVKRLEVITTPNQDPVLPPYVPLIGVDMWEHAFYLQYKNVKPNYLAAIWNVINWKEAERRLAESPAEL
ncbi:unnamed protein product [Rhizoctonia solani]|uniref:Superoxide dismutase n=1 Tax=Rhizoctonia solani TaxID=456999 RepID=A0A8H3B527_9AGAM|nr:unnamed protein product [Rhizoctonia solani]